MQLIFKCLTPKFSRLNLVQPLRKLRPKQPRKNRKNEIFAKQSFLSIDGRSVNGNALFVKGKCTTAVALDGKKIQQRKTLDFAFPFVRPLSKDKI